MNYILGIFLSISLVIPFGAHASILGVEPQSQLALLNNAIQNLLGLGSNKVQTADTELSLRKKIILQIIDLSLQDITDMKRNVQNIKNTGTTETDTIAQRLSQELNRIKLEYDGFASELQNFTSIEDLKKEASKVLETRKSAENLSRVIQMTASGFGNREAITITNARLDKVIYDVRKLEEFQILRKGTFDVALQAAQEHIAYATDAQNKLEKLIIQTFQPASEISTSSLIEERTTIETTLDNPTAPLQITLDAKNIQDALAGSLQEIKAAYLVFIEIGRTIKIVVK